ncbi:MAG: thioesterase domain-containing protein, partial [Bacteroidota bacterium]
KIWEELLDYSPISPNDDFFELGGTSLLAVRLFARIKKKFDKNLPPITLLQHRTIRGLAGLLAEDEVAWTTVVPLKASGHKAPIFCLHAGLGHVFFYHPLAKALGSDHPVYAIQPEGLDGETEMHETIEEMAAFYLEEIKKVQPEGPYVFLGYCHSTAVALEMGRMLLEAGESLPELLIVDSAPREGELDQVVSERTAKKSLRWYLGSLKVGKYQRVFDDLAVNYIPKIFLSKQRREMQDVHRLKQGLVAAYERYIWPTYEGKGGLFISKEFSERPDKMARMDNWGGLLKGGVEKIIVESDHATIFEAGNVDLLAERIGAYLDS